MPTPLYRDDVHKFSVYRLRDIPDGVPRSGYRPIAGDHTWWSTIPRERCPTVEVMRQRYQRYLARCAMGNISPGDENVCCAVLDEYAGPLLAPRFAVGMRVRPTERFLTGSLRPGVIIEIGSGDGLRVHQDGRGVPGGVFYAQDIWEPEPPTTTVTRKPAAPIAIPAEDFHREQTRHLGAQGAELNLGVGKHPTNRAAWSAHLRFLVDRSEKERRDRAPSVLMPHDDD